MRQMALVGLLWSGCGAPGEEGERVPVSGDPCDQMMGCPRCLTGASRCSYGGFEADVDGDCGTCVAQQELFEQLCDAGETWVEGEFVCMGSIQD